MLRAILHNLESDLHLEALFKKWFEQGQKGFWSTSISRKVMQ